MAINLLAQLREYFTNSATDRAGDLLGENSAATRKAVDGILPTIVGGVAEYVQDSDRAKKLYDLLRKTPVETDPNLDTTIQNANHRQEAIESGGQFVNQIFGDRANRVTDAIANYSGTRPQSASSLTSLAMSILMAILGRRITTDNLSPAGLAALLANETDSVRQAMPAGLAGALAGLLGLFGLSSATSRPVTTTTTTTTTAVPPVVDREERRGRPGWLPWLLAALGALLLFLLLRNCTGDNKEAGQVDPASGVTLNDGESVVEGDSTQGGAGAAAADTVATDDRAGAGVDTANGPEVRVAVDLPNKRRLNVVENSFNYNLAQYLSNKNREPDRVFTFDNLTFETNSATITAQARPNVDDLIQIMQAYPSLVIRIEGNTDSTGPDALNDPLSAERAQAVKDALVKAGIPASRVATRELGERKPVATNKTDAGREKNRRIDVRVVKI